MYTKFLRGPTVPFRFCQTTSLYYSGVNLFGKVYVLLKVPITYIMLNLTGRVRGHCITYNRFYIYINKSDTMTDLKGSCP